MSFIQAVASSAQDESVGLGGPGWAALDGVGLNNGDLVLLTRQNTPSQNGLWVWSGAGAQLQRPGAPSQYQIGNVLDNATVVWVTGGTARGGTVWGLSEGKVVTVDTTSHNLGRVSLAPVQCRVATTTDINLASTFTTIDGVTLFGNAAAGSDIVFVGKQATASENGFYWANSAGAMMRCIEPLVSGRVARVSEGLVNARTEWTIYADTNVIERDTTPIHVRRDVDTHAFATLNDMKSYPGFNGLHEGDIGNLSGYRERGDGGGGEFTFIEVPKAAHVVDATPVVLTITAAASTDAVGEITVGAHGFPANAIVSVWIDGDLSYGNPQDALNTLNGPFRMIRTSTTTLAFYQKEVLNLTLGGGGAEAHYVLIETEDPHGRQLGERLAIAGVELQGGAADINSAFYFGAPHPTDDEKLLLPIFTTGGTYVPSDSACVGDDAKMVVAANGGTTADTMQCGIWKRNIVEPLHPRWFGAYCDQMRDDWPALVALDATLPDRGGRIAWPRAVSWCSETWVITKSVKLVGEGGSAYEGSGIEVAPGYTAIEVGLGGHWIGHISVASKVLYNGEAVMAGGGNGITAFPITTWVRRGDCAVDGVVDEVFYRALDEGVVAGAPAWPMGPAVGDVFTDSGIRWRVEAFPTARVDTTLYNPGDRVFAENDNRQYFECVATGTSGTQPGDEIHLSLRNYKAAGGNELGQIFYDYGMSGPQWLTKLAAGFLVRSTQGTLSSIYAVRFSGAAIHVVGGDETIIGVETNADKLPRPGSLRRVLRARHVRRRWRHERLDGGPPVRDQHRHVPPELRCSWSWRLCVP